MLGSVRWTWYLRSTVPPWHFRVTRSTGVRIKSDAPLSRFPAILQKERDVTPTRSYVQFLNHARGSLYDLQTQLKIAQHLNYVNPEQAQRLRAQADRAGQLLIGLIRSFRTASQARDIKYPAPRAESRALPQHLQRKLKLPGIVRRRSLSRHRE